MGVPWLDIMLEQLLEIPRGPLTLLEFFFEPDALVTPRIRGLHHINAPSKVAGVLEEYGKERPSTSRIELMVLALSDGRVVHST
jgi:hypothetical protein